VKASKSVSRLAITLAVMIAISGCSGGDDSISGSRPSTTARLAIVAPRNGEVVDGPTVQMEVSLEGARIVPTTSTNLTPDEGHIHVFLDGRLAGMNFDVEEPINDVGPGTHVLRVEFVAVDHAPFDPRVFAEVAFEVSG
jgi:hypothetical protein